MSTLIFGHMIHFDDSVLFIIQFISKISCTWDVPCNTSRPEQRKKKDGFLRCDFLSSKVTDKVALSHDCVSPQDSTSFKGRIWVMVRGFRREHIPVRGVSRD